MYLWIGSGVKIESNFPVHAVANVTRCLRTQRLLMHAACDSLVSYLSVVLCDHRRTGLQNLGGADVSPPDERGTRENS